MTEQLGDAMRPALVQAMVPSRASSATSACTAIPCSATS